MDEKKKRAKRCETRGRKSNWQHAPTTAIRVPAMFADALLEIAREMDEGTFLYNKKLSQETQQIEATILYKNNHAKKKERDARLDHPAIIAVHSVMGRYPNKAVWDEIIQKVGDAPDVDRMKVIFAAWGRVSQNAFNLATWLFDWYLTGMPEARSGNGKFSAKVAAGIPSQVDWAARKEAELRERERGK